MFTHRLYTESDDLRIVKRGRQRRTKVGRRVQIVKFFHCTKPYPDDLDTTLKDIIAIIHNDTLERN